MKRYKNKGFTLVELIAIIIVLAAIFLVAFPMIINSSKKADNQKYNMMVSVLCDAGKSYVYSNPENYELNAGDRTVIPISELVEYGIVDSEMKNPRTDEFVSNDKLLIEKQSDSTLSCTFQTTQRIDAPTQDVCKTNLVYTGQNIDLIKERNTNVVYTNSIGKDAGDYTITAALGPYSSAVWSDGTNGEKTFTCSIAKADDVINVLPTTHEYAATQFEATVTTKSGQTASKTYYSDSTCTTTATPTIPGDYYITATTTGNSNYNAANSGCKKAITINKAQLAATLNCTTTKIYDNTANASCTLALSKKNVVYTPTYTCSYDSKDVGLNKPITCNVTALANTNVNYYAINSEDISTVGNIYNATLTFNTPEETLNGVSPLYIRKGQSGVYTGLTNSTAGEIPTASKIGYTFNGWNSPSGIKIINANKTLVSGVSGWVNTNGTWLLTSNQTLTSILTANTYTITVNSSGGVIPATTGWTVASNNQTATKSGTYDANYGTLPSPTKDSYYFDGWTYVPQEYQQVEYISSSGTQYIDTGVASGNDNLNIKVKYSWNTFPASNSYAAVLGAYSSENNNSTRILNKGNTVTYVNLNQRAVASLGLTTTRVLNTIYEDNIVKLGGTLHYKSNNEVISSSNLTAGTAYTGNIAIFAQNTSGSAKSSIKLYSMQIYNGTTLVRNFVPCVRKSDSVVGLYDTANGVFYTNAGTGDFEAGEESYIESSDQIHIAANHTLYAHYSTYKLTLKYNVNGGSITTDTSSSTRYRVGTDSLVEISKDSGATWKDLTVSITADSTYTNLHDVATYGAIKRGYGVVDTSAYNTLANGTGADINQNYTSSSTSNPATINRINGSALTENKTLPIYIKWTPNIYTITLNNQSATTAGTTAIYEKYDTGYYLNKSGSTVSNAMSTSANAITKPTKTGYTFAGYYTQATGGTQYIDANGKLTTSASNSNFAEDSVLYAHWTITNPTTPTISGGETRIYGSSTTTLTCATTSNYATGTSKYYSFGYATSDGGTPSNWTSASTTATLTVAADAYVGIRYYSCKVYASDGTNTSSTVASLTSADTALTINNAKITFDASTTGGLISGDTAGTKDLYAKKGVASIYTGIRNTTSGTIPSGTKEGFTFAGWYTQATGGTKVLNANGTFTGSAVTGYTTASAWDATENKTLYAHWTITNPATPTISGGETRIYGSSTTTLTCATTSTYASDTNKYYSFGYATSDGGTPSNWTSASTTATLTVAADAYVGIRYYSCKVYASDGTNTSSTVASLTSADTALTINNAKITFDATTNSGTLSGSQNVYTKKGVSVVYTGIRNTITGTIPTASRDEYRFNGWYTASTGGTKVLNADGTFTGSAVTGYTTASAWDIIENKTLYAQFTPYKLTLKYHVNGGVLLSSESSTRYRKGSDSLIEKSTDSGNTWEDVVTDITTNTTYYDLTNVATYDVNKAGYYITASKAYNTKADGTGVDVSQDDTSSNTTNKVTVARINGSALTADKTINMYVNWQRRSYTLSYTLNSGTVSNANPTSFNVTTSTITLNNPARVGFAFTGWTEQISSLNWVNYFVNMTTGRLETNSSWPDSYVTELIRLKSGVAYTLTGLGDYSTSYIRWRVYNTDGTYVGNGSNATTYTPSSDCYVRVMLYNAPTSTQRSNVKIESSAGTTATIPKGSTGNRIYIANWVDSEAPELSLSKDTYVDSPFGSWTLNNATVSSGVLTMSAANALPTSNLLDVNGGRWWPIFDGNVNATASGSSNGSIMFGTDHYSTDYGTAYTVGGYSHNGWSVPLQLNTWVNGLNWYSGKDYDAQNRYNSTLKYVILSFGGANGTYNSGPTTKIRNVKMYGDTMPNTFYNIYIDADDNVGVTQTKIAKGNRAASYFATGGDIVSGSVHEVNENATYTVFVRDAVGNSTVQTITISDIDTQKPTVTISGGTTVAVSSQPVTLKCTDNYGVTAYYWGTTEPTAATSIKTATLEDLAALKSTNGLTKNVTAAGTYYLGCRDNAGNWDVKNIIIRKYQIQRVLLNVGGTAATYTSDNYTTTGSTYTYYIKNGTQLAPNYSTLYADLVSEANGTFKGYTTTAPSETAVTPATSTLTVANDNTTKYYMWFYRSTFTVTLNAGTGGSLTGKQKILGGSKSVSSGGSDTLTVRYGDKVEATVTPNSTYYFTGFSGGYISGTTNPTLGAEITANKTITANFAEDTTPPTVILTHTGSKIGGTATDSGTGIVAYAITTGSTAPEAGNSAWKTVTGGPVASFTIPSTDSDTNHTSGGRYVHVKDAAGKVGTRYTSVVSHIMKKSTTSNLTYTSSGRNMTCDTSNSSLATCSLSNDGNNYTIAITSKTTDGDVKVKVYYSDGSVYRVYNVKIDGTAPLITLTHTGSQIGGTITDSGTGVTAYLVNTTSATPDDSASWTTISNGPVSSFSIPALAHTSGTKCYHAKDDVGNIRNICIKVADAYLKKNVTQEFSVASTVVGNTCESSNTSIATCTLTKNESDYTLAITSKSTNGTAKVRVYYPASTGGVYNIYNVTVDGTAPTATITGGTTVATAEQHVKIKCADNVGTTAYYWSTSAPASEDSIAATANLSTVTGTEGLDKAITASGTYYLGCRDAAGNWSTDNIIIRKYQIQRVLLNVGGTAATYTSDNYTTTGSTYTYYIKNGTQLAPNYSTLYADLVSAANGTFRGYTTTAPSENAATPATTTLTVADNNTTKYYMWFYRSTFDVTLNAGVGGSLTARQNALGGSKVVPSGGSDTITVRYGDKIVATATPDPGYNFSGFSGGYVSGTTSPVTGAEISADKTITASFTPKILTVTLNNQSATTAGTASIFERFADGYYLNNSNGTVTNKMTVSANPITKPAKDDYSFRGYWTGSNSTDDMYVNESGYLTDAASATNYTSNGTLIARWEKNNYQVGSKYYATLANAYSACSSYFDDDATCTIKVNAANTDSSSITIESGNKVILNTNGLTVTKTTAAIINKGVLTITGNGTITASAVHTINNSNGGTLTVNGPTIKNTATSTYYPIVNTGSTFTLKSGTINSSSVRAIVNGNINITGGTVTLTNNTTAHAYAVVTEGTLTMTGGSISISRTNSSTTNATQYYSRAISKTGSGNLVITGGSITTTCNLTKTSESKNNSCYGIYLDSTATGNRISGLTLTVTKNGDSPTYGMQVSSGSTMVFGNGNNFSSNSLLLLAYGTTTFDTVTSSTYTSTGSNAVYTASSAGKVTIKSGNSFTGTTAISFTSAVTSSGFLKIEGGTITGTSYYAVQNASAAPVTITDGTLTSPNYAVYNSSSGVLTFGNNDANISLEYPHVERTSGSNAVIYNKNGGTATNIYIYDGLFYHSGLCWVGAPESSGTIATMNPNTIIYGSSNLAYQNPNYQLYNEGIGWVSGGCAGTKAYIKPRGGTPELSVSIDKASDYTKTKTAVIKIRGGDKTDGHLRTLTAGTYTIKYGVYASDATAPACSSLSNSKTITVSGTSTTEATVEITNLGSGLTGSKRIYACNSTAISDTSSSLPANTRVFTAFNVDNTAPTITYSTANSTVTGTGTTKTAGYVAGLFVLKATCSDSHSLPSTLSTTGESTTALDSNNKLVIEHTFDDRSETSAGTNISYTCVDKAGNSTTTASSKYIIYRKFELSFDKNTSTPSGLSIDPPAAQYLLAENTTQGGGHQMVFPQVDVYDTDIQVGGFNTNKNAFTTELGWIVTHFDNEDEYREKVDMYYGTGTNTRTKIYAKEGSICKKKIYIISYREYPKISVNGARASYLAPGAGVSNNVTVGTTANSNNNSNIKIASDGSVRVYNTRTDAWITGLTGLCYPSGTALYVNGTKACDGLGNVNAPNLQCDIKTLGGTFTCQ